MGPAHFGVAFAAKSLAPKAPLWALLIASMLIDLLCFAFTPIGIEKMAVAQTDFEHGVQTITSGWTPWSHGLFMSIVWSAAAALIAWALIHDRRAGIMLGMVVFSHWALDFMVHLPDLPLFFIGSPLLGLGLWGSGPGLVASAILEIGLLFGGIVIYILWRKKK
jgi:hypothetical protein